MPRWSNSVPQLGLTLRCNKHQVLRHSYREVGSKLRASASCFSANASGAGCSGHDHDLALKAEEVLELGSFGNCDRHVEGMEKIRGVLNWVGG
jgi:hypothetical protein